MKQEKSILDQQLERLKSKFSTTRYLLNDKCAGTIYISDFKLPEWWSMKKADVYFDIPVGYPFANPEHFYVSNTDLKVKVQLPDSKYYTNPTTTSLIEINNKKYLKFWWRVRAWSPNNDDLLTYARVIQARFREKK